MKTFFAPETVLVVIKKIVGSRDLPFFPKTLAIHMAIEFSLKNKPFEMLDKHIMSKLEVDKGTFNMALHKLKHLKIIRRHNEDDHNAVPIYSVIELE